MRYIIQFNEFVFQRAVEVESPTAFKDDVISYTYTHGGYSPGKVLAEVGRLAITVKLVPSELPCDMRPYYTGFFKSQMATPGKLWAIDDGVLLWTNAKINNISRVQGTNDYDVEFVLLEGIWHKANLQRTFIKPWDVCTFMDCYRFQTIQPCETEQDSDCCKCVDSPHPTGCDCCECHALSKEMALCYHLDELKDFKPCEPSFQAVFSCDGAERYFDEFGQKLCGTCDVITGNVYSDTDIPTNGITIRFKGKVHNPYIEINGNGNGIKGDYRNLVIKPDGTIMNGCMKCDLDAADWVVPAGHDYGWTMHQGYNRVLIENCCGSACVWIETDAITV